ncbi:hypothetical protein CUT44_13990 [Streptomyces carminius]|uniref:Lipoprotein n=1 Tax=Streptomyces carminius TaxID=2665496 RepID=A0A2M8LZ33_9ACTN|nr:hypothetical protein [Streptomyces carminius]PJE97201.1 hypothetical protein CUT44_13990 [Streptomyces carminius]
MKRTPHGAAVLTLGAVLIAGATACNVDTTKPPNKDGLVAELPADPDMAQSRKKAREFRSWVDKHGSTQQKDAVGRVQRIIGEWNEKTGSVYVSTDINGGRTPVRDPEAAAAAIVVAFDDWQDSGQGHVSVYDVFGNAMTADNDF